MAEMLTFSTFIMNLVFLIMIKSICFLIFFVLISVPVFSITGMPSGDVIFRPLTAYASTFLNRDTMPLYSVDHNSFRIYFKDISYTAGHLPRIRSDLDTAYGRILDVLQIKEYNNGIYLIAVDSKEEMEKLMGYKIKGGAAKGQDLVFFVFNDTIRPQFRHEIFHLISYEAWGYTLSRLLDEGGATYCDNFCYYENPMYSINAYFLREKRLFCLHDLMYNFDESAKDNDVIAYIQSAGVFKYLYEKYGTDKLKQLWLKGFDEFHMIYGFSTDQLEKEWLEEIKKIPVPKDIDEKLLMANGCG